MEEPDPPKNEPKSDLNSPVLHRLEARMGALEARLERIERQLSFIITFFEPGSRSVCQGRGAISSHKPMDGKEGQIDKDQPQERGEIQDQSNPSHGPRPTEQIASHPSTPQQHAPQHPQRERNPDKLSAYEYQPLDASKSQIRMMALTPSSSNTDPVEGTMIHVSLDRLAASKGTLKHPKGGSFKFNALSYTWGEMKLESSMILHGRRLPITRNLEAALRQLRRDAASTSPSSSKSSIAASPNDVIFWWIDAICINQADIDERNSQVLLMRRIFNCVDQVRIWLGEEADDSGRAIQVANQVAFPPKRGPGEPPVEYPETTEDDKLRNWEALAALFRRAWWSRAWIRQEVALARTAVVQCSAQVCAFDTLVHVGMALEYASESLGYDPTKLASSVVDQAGSTSWKPFWFQSAKILHQMAGATSRGTKFMDLTELLFHARDARATDMRDKVFAVLGLADPAIYNLQVNYRLTVSQVYTSAVKAIISRTRKLTVLGMCQNAERLHGLPSWVPNLVDPWKQHPFPIDTYHETMNEDASFALTEGEEEMSVRGSRYDVIEVINKDHVRERDSAEQLQDVYRSWREFVKSKLPEALKYRLLPPPSVTRPLLMTYSSALLIGATSDTRWLSFLSIGTMPTQSTYRYPATNTSELDTHLVNSLLIPKHVPSFPDPYSEIHQSLRRYCVGRRLALLEAKGFAIIPEDAQAGDEIVCFKGAPYPIILRQREGRLVVVGEAYPSDFHMASALDGKAELVQLQLRSSRDSANELGLSSFSLKMCRTKHEHDVMQMNGRFGTLRVSFLLVGNTARGGWQRRCCAPSRTVPQMPGLRNRIQRTVLAAPGSLASLSLAGCPPSAESAYHVQAAYLAKICFPIVQFIQRSNSNPFRFINRTLVNSMAHLSLRIAIRSLNDVSRWLTIFGLGGSVWAQP